MDISFSKVSEIRDNLIITIEIIIIVKKTDHDLLIVQIINSIKNVIKKKSIKIMIIIKIEIIIKITKTKGQDIEYIN